MPGKHRNKVSLQQMTDAIYRIETYVGDSTKAQFEADYKSQDACIRQIQIIGEAANRVSKDFQNDHPIINWAQIIGLRNIVVHDYEGVDLDIIWNVMTSSLAVLQNNLAAIIETLPDEDL